MNFHLLLYDMSPFPYVELIIHIYFCVSFSEPLMDLLVTLCAKYRLNPSSHTLELITSNKNNIKLKPSALIGTLDAEKIILKPKGEDKNKKTGPQMPEVHEYIERYSLTHTVNTTTDYQPVSFCVLQATVRMVINYKKTQKTILRVNPRVPLAELLPAICEKCEFDVETTILLKDVQSRTPLNLSNSLNDYAIREVYARDTQGECYYSKRPNSLVLHIGYPMCFLLYLSSLLVVCHCCVFHVLH